MALGDSPATESLADALPKEIERVREVQDQYKSMRGMRNVNVEPAILMMEHDIQKAVKACAAGDVVEMLRCYTSLKETGS